MKSLHVLLARAACCVALGWSLPAWATEAAAPAGMIKRVQGTVTLERAGKNIPVQVGDRIRTAPRSAVGIALADDTLLSAGPGSELVVNTFTFDTTSHEGSVVARLLRGTLHVVTGLVGKAKPQNVQIQTPTVVLGVRGTEFVVETQGPAS
jgi:hypothetical protein